MFIVIGAVAMYISRNYPYGSALRMGPGYFPTWLGAIMAGLGAWIFIESFFVEGVGMPPWAPRPLLVLTATMCAFGLMMDEFDVGFVPALVVLVAGCGLAHHDVKWGEMILLCILLPIFCIALFIYIIGLPYKLFWWQ